MTIIYFFFICINSYPMRNNFMRKNFSKFFTQKIKIDLIFTCLCYCYMNLVYQ